MERFLFKDLLRPVILTALVVLAAVLLVAGGVWLGGGIRTDGPYVDWQAIAALAAVGGTVATVLAVGALGFAARELENRAYELRHQQEMDRVTRAPYLRVDVGFAGVSARGFSAPAVAYVFDSADFDPTHSLSLFNEIAPRVPPHDGSIPLIVWATNLQSAPLGIAYNIRIRLLVAWDDVDPSKAAETEISFTYLAPGQTTAFKVTDVRRDIPWLFAKVTEVVYEDIFSSESLPEAHGALTMLYDRNTGVRNERSFQLSR